MRWVPSRQECLHVLDRLELSLPDFIKYPTIYGLAELIEKSILSNASDEKLLALVEILESQSPA